MSAYVVDRNHIRYLMNAALSFTRDGTLRLGKYDSNDRIELHNMSDFENAAEIGQALWNENIKSVLHRYPNDTEDNMPGPIGETYAFSTADFEACWDHFNPIAVLKACACYEYQSCEHEDYYQSDAHDFIDQLKDCAICNLPGYSDAKWGAPEPPNVTRVFARK